VSQILEGAGTGRHHVLVIFSDMQQETREFRLGSAGQCGGSERVQKVRDKKLEVGEAWNLYPAVLQVNGSVATRFVCAGKSKHTRKDFIYIEWWQDGRK